MIVDKKTGEEIERLRAVFDAAYGLCMGYDWNNGTAAKTCGYRRKLLSAVNAIKEIPDFESKYRSPETPIRRATNLAAERMKMGS